MGARTCVEDLEVSRCRPFMKWPVRLVTVTPTFDTCYGDAEWEGLMLDLCSMSRRAVTEQGGTRQPWIGCPHLAFWRLLIVE